MWSTSGFHAEKLKDLVDIEAKYHADHNRPFYQTKHLIKAYDEHEKFAKPWMFRRFVWAVEDRIEELLDDRY